MVASELGLRATFFYLAVYLLMNVAAFAVVVARERVSEHGDDLAAIEDLGRTQPWLALPMTIAMLSLAGFPATGGFIGKFYLIDASVSGDYTWLGIVIVVGSVVSLAYYLRVIAVMWMGRYEVELPGLPRRRVKPVAGWSPEADMRASPRWRRWRSSSRRPPSSSASGRTRCSTSRGTWAARCRACAEPAPGASSAIRRPVRRSANWLLELERLDAELYATIAETDIPPLDRAMYRLSEAANYSRCGSPPPGCWRYGRQRGRQAAVDGIASIAVTSLIVNAGLKPLGRGGARAVPSSPATCECRGHAPSRPGTLPRPSPSPPGWPEPSRASQWPGARRAGGVLARAHRRDFRAMWWWGAGGEALAPMATGAG